MKLILASYLDLYDKDELGNRIPKNFGNQNQILATIKKYVKKYDNFLFVASNEYNNESTDLYAVPTFKSFSLTLPFKNYNILDSRTEADVSKLVEEADLIFLSGGHVPTQNEFFKNINLKEEIKKTKALIIGGSAGAMNMANKVYAIPELDGESIDPNYQRTLDGLGLTNINIFPHFDEERYYLLDGKRVVEDIVLPDTYEKTVYAINNGSYILIDDDKAYIYGEAYLLKDGQIEKINNENEVKELSEISIIKR